MKIRNSNIHQISTSQVWEQMIIYKMILKKLRIQIQRTTVRALLNNLEIKIVDLMYFNNRMMNKSRKRIIEHLNINKKIT